MRRTKQEAEQTRQAILQKAMELFSVKGVSGTSLLEIAKHTGLSRGALYWHFKDKWDIFDALWEQCAAPLTQVADLSREQQEMDPIGKLELLICMIFSRITQDADFRRVIQMCLVENGMLCKQDVTERMRVWRNQFHVRRIKTLQNAVAKGQLPQDFDVEGGSRYIHATIDGILINWFQEQQSYCLQHRAPSYARAIIAGLQTIRLPTQA